MSDKEILLKVTSAAPLGETTGKQAPTSSVKSSGGRKWNRNLATIVVANKTQLDPNASFGGNLDLSRSSLRGDLTDEQRKTYGRLSVDSRGETPQSTVDMRHSIDIRAAMQQAAAAALEQQDETETDKQKTVMANSDSWIRSAIPILPLWLSILCLTLNIILPGTGTILSGVTVFFCGQPRIYGRDDPVLSTFCVNMWVGMAQMFTVTFLLVGWFWSISWGVYMISLTEEARRRRNRELTALALNAFGGSRMSRS